MPRFAGWMDHQRDLTGEEPTVAGMTTVLRAGGEPVERLWSHPRVVLGQRGTAQGALAPHAPEVVKAGGRLLGSIVFDGALTNAAEIRSQLTARGREVRTRSDARTVLYAVLEWGPQAAERLDGMFAFAAWTEFTAELLLCRDRFGIKPLSYAPLPTGVAFASELPALTRHPLVPTELDAGGLCAVLSQVRAPGLSALRGVREVRPAHVVRVHRGGITEQRYWSLAAREHEHNQEQTLKTVRALLEEAIEREAADAEPAVLLSGGLDSSALTGLLAARRDAPRTFTVAIGEDRVAPDRRHAEEVARHLDCRHQDVLVQPEELTHPDVEASALAAKDYPSPFGDKNLTPYLLYREVAAQVPMALSGEAADAVFGGIGDTEVGPPAPHERTFPWIERARRLGMPHGIGNGLIHPEVLRQADLNGYCAARYDEARAEVPHLDGATGNDRLARETDYLRMTRLYEQTVNHSERLATAVGLQVRFPFSDHRLFGYLYNVPWQMKTFDGREKSLLRAIAHDHLPVSVLTRPKVPFPITYHQLYKERLAQRLRSLLADHNAPVRPLLDLAAARQVADQPRLLDRGGWLGRADAELVLQLDAWLRQLDIRLSL